MLALLSLAGLAGRFAQHSTEFHDPGYQVRPVAYTASVLGDECSYLGFVCRGAKCLLGIEIIRILVDRFTRGRWNV